MIIIILRIQLKNVKKDLNLMIVNYLIELCNVLKVIKEISLWMQLYIKSNR